MNSNDTDTNPRIQNQEFEEFEVISEGSEKFVREKRTNVKSDLIEITEDKLENILLKHVQLLEVRKSWITPLSLFVAIMLTNLSATFGDKLGIKGPVWEAMFLLGALCCGIWILVSIIYMIIKWKKSSLSNLIAIIKNVKELPPPPPSEPLRSTRRPFLSVPLTMLLTKRDPFPWESPALGMPAL